jgi:hypothetical protein
MIPLLGAVSIRPTWSPGFRLWIPLPFFLVWLVLLPIALVLSPLFLAGCLACQVSPVRVLSATWQLLAALSQTRLEVDHGGSAFRIHIL